MSYFNWKHGNRLRQYEQMRQGGAHFLQPHFLGKHFFNLKKLKNLTIAFYLNFHFTIFYIIFVNTKIQLTDVWRGADPARGNDVAGPGAGGASDGRGRPGHATSAAGGVRPGGARERGFSRRHPRLLRRARRAAQQVPAGHLLHLFVSGVCDRGGARRGHPLLPRADHLRPRVPPARPPPQPVQPLRTRAFLGRFQLRPVPGN